MSLKRLQNRYWLGLQSLGSIQVLTVKEYVSELTHIVVNRIQFLLACWTEGLTSFWLLVRGLSQFLVTWASPYSSSRQTRWIPLEETRKRTKESQQERSHALCNPIWELTSDHFCWIVFIRSESLGAAHFKRMGWILGHDYQEV